MKVYLAAPYSMREEIEIIAFEFERASHTVTSRWVHGGEFNKSGPDAARMDCDDVLAADVLILKTFPRGTMVTGGGRHFEFGLAYGHDKDCIIVGEREHIFCHLPDIHQVNDWAEALDLVSHWESQESSDSDDSTKDKSLWS